jgi:APA family basic amino acid/polyamine antiporter
MIGSGVFLLPASLAAFGGISIVGWLFSATGALIVALMFSRLSRLMTKAGGPYGYAQRGFGDFIGFLVGWGYWISIWAGNAAISTAFAGYLGVFIPGVSGSAAAAAATAVGAIWLLTWVNSTGVRNAGIMQVATTALKLLPLIAIGTMGLLYFDVSNMTPFNVSGGSTFGAITGTATLTLWAFLGLESATIPADDVEDPERTISKATVLGTLAAATVYILGTVGVMGVISSTELATSQAPFADAAAVMWGGWATYAVAAGAAISCFGALNGWILLSGQMPMAMARDKLFPGAFARQSGRGIPLVGLILSSVLASVLILMNYTRGFVPLYTFIILLATLTTLVPYVFCSLVELLMRPNEVLRGGRPALWTLIPGLAFVFSLWTVAGSGRDTVYWGFLLLMAGVPVFVWNKWRGSVRKSKAPIL